MSSPSPPADDRAAFLAGILGAGAAVAADLALQYTSDASHLGSQAYAYLLDVSGGRLLWGHFVGVPAILLEILGFWAVARGLEPAGAGATRVFRWLATAAFALGAAFHAMFAPIGLMLRAARDGGAAPDLLLLMAGAARRAHAGLGLATVLGIVLLSLVFSVVVARGRSDYPRWLAAVSPFALALVFALVCKVVPAWRLVLLPAGLNLANLLFFTLAWWRLRRRRTRVDIAGRGR